MATHSNRSRLLVGAAVAIAGLSCGGDSPTRPSSTLAPPPIAPTSVVRVEVAAPATIAPQASVQLTATAIKSDGSREDVTSQAGWLTSNALVVQVGPTGMATALKIGEVTVSSRFQGRIGSARVLAVPDGTFKLTGRVVESGFPIGDVNLLVIAGIGQGTATVSAPDGRFTLLGVGGRILLQAKKDGYQNKVDELTVAASQTHDVEVRADRPRPNLAGDYSLTIAAACSAGALSALPEAARRRTYDATITQEGPILNVRLNGGDFAFNSGFSGSVEPTGSVSFTFGEFYYYGYALEPGIVERLGGNTELAIGGYVTAAVTPGGLAGTMNGYIDYRERGVFPVRVTHCGAEDHQFAMEQR